MLAKRNVTFAIQENAQACYRKTKKSVMPGDPHGESVASRITMPFVVEARVDPNPEADLVATKTKAKANSLNQLVQSESARLPKGMFKKISIQPHL